MYRDRRQTVILGRGPVSLRWGICETGCDRDALNGGGPGGTSHGSAASSGRATEFGVGDRESCAAECLRLIGASQRRMRDAQTGVVDS